jgi:hypothetical protein
LTRYSYTPRRLQFHTIFDDADADGEADQEYEDDEFDEPIVEEDEEAEAENPDMPHAL